MRTPLVGFNLGLTFKLSNTSFLNLRILKLLTLTMTLCFIVKSFNYHLSRRRFRGIHIVYLGFLKQLVEFLQFSLAFLLLWLLLTLKLASKLKLFNRSTQLNQSLRLLQCQHVTFFEFSATSFQRRKIKNFTKKACSYLKKICL